MTRYSLKGLAKPALIMLSTYMLVNVVGFFLQHDFEKVQSLAILKHRQISSREYIGKVTIQPMVIHTPMAVVKSPSKKKKNPGPGVKIFPSGKNILP
jgi:hypothetical protein